MKKILAVFCILALAITLPTMKVRAQQSFPPFVQSQIYTGTTVPGGQGSIYENSLVLQHTLTWTVSGSVSSCTVQLETSAAGTTFALMSGSVAQTCTSSGSYTFSGVAAQFVRFNITAFSATGNVTITYTGYSQVQNVSFTDNVFWVPESTCGGSITGTVGTGNATDIVALSGGVRVFRLSNTAAGASNNTFTCVFNVPSRLTAGKGIAITDFTFLVSTQTTQPTSIPTPTVKTFTPPAAVDPETANSATFVGAGGVITISPTSAQFAAYTAVAAGQFFSVKIIPTTAIVINTDLQMIQVILQFNQSAAAAGVQEVAGIAVHYNNVPF